MTERAAVLCLLLRDIILSVTVLYYIPVACSGKGQGLAAARQLNGGELLLISPALATVTEDDLEVGGGGERD